MRDPLQQRGGTEKLARSDVGENEVPTVLVRGAEVDVPLFYPVQEMGVFPLPDDGLALLVGGGGPLLGEAGGEALPPSVGIAQVR